MDIQIGKQYLKLGKTIAGLKDYSDFFVGITPSNPLEFNDDPETTIDGTYINTTQRAYYRPRLTIEFSYKSPQDYNEIISIVETREFVAEYFDTERLKPVIRLMRLEHKERESFQVWSAKYRGVVNPKFTFVSKLGYRTVDEYGNFIDHAFLDSVDQFDASGKRTSHDERIF